MVQRKKKLTVNDHWKKVIFSDESQVVIGVNKRVYIWRRDDEKYRPHLICQRPNRKLSLMIWGCVCYEGIGILAAVQGNINSVKYIDILEKNLLPTIVWYFEDDNYIFMDDNATVHRSHLLDNYKTENGLNSMEWPAQSPDLNILENIWLIIKRELKKLSEEIRTKLFEKIERIWQNISLAEIQKLYQSIPDRLKNVITIKGHLTKY